MQLLAINILILENGLHENFNSTLGIFINNIQRGKSFFLICSRPSLYVVFITNTEPILLVSLDLFKNKTILWKVDYVVTKLVFGNLEICCDKTWIIVGNYIDT